MAEPAQGASGRTGTAGKHRNPFAVWLGLPIITLGIYQLVWYYKVNNEARNLDRRIEVSPAVAVVAVTLGAFILVPPFVSYYRTGKRIAAMQQAAGLAVTCNAVIGLVLQVLVFGSGTLYYQFELNKVWDRFGNALPGTPVDLAT